MLHVEMIEDKSGDLVDIGYYCSQGCAIEAGIPQPSAWPGGMGTDYCQICTVCECVITHGIEECSCEDE